MGLVTKAEALKRLRKCAENRDTERAHQAADGVLLDLINDDEIRAAWFAVDKWYA